MNTMDRIAYRFSLPFTRARAEELDEFVCCLEATGHCPLLKMRRREIKALRLPETPRKESDPDYCPYIAQLLLSDEQKFEHLKYVPSPDDGRHRRCVAKVLRVKLIGKVLKTEHEPQG